MAVFPYPYELVVLQLAMPEDRPLLASMSVGNIEFSGFPD
jgi:hypothetical protein